jgi:hypothetical protein
MLVNSKLTEILNVRSHSGNLNQAFDQQKLSAILLETEQSTSFLTAADTSFKMFN